MKLKISDGYFATVPVEQRPLLEILRQIIRKAVPKGRECISYGTAAFELDQRPMFAVGGWANHCAFPPMGTHVLTGFGAESKKVSPGKGTIPYSCDKPLPAVIVRKLVKARIAEIKT